MINAGTTLDANLNSTLSSEQGKCSSPTEYTDAEDGHISKDASLMPGLLMDSHDKYNITEAIYKSCIRLNKSGENEVDLMKWAWGIYQDENKNSSFNHEKAWAVLRKHAKWDAPDPASVDLTEDENVHDEHVLAVNTDEVFGPDPRPRPP
nr:hypothetical protein [Tanacetum cinerariifolium]